MKIIDNNDKMFSGAIKLSDLKGSSPKNTIIDPLPDTDEICAATQKTEYSQCYISAMKILAYADRSEKQLREKLIDKGFEADDINCTIHLLKEKKYLSDPRLMELTIKHLAKRKLYGRGRIKAELLLKFGRTSVDKYYQKVSENLEEELDYYEIALTLAKKHKDRDRKYIFAKLKQNGFASDEIGYALENFTNGSDD